MTDTTLYVLYRGDEVLDGGSACPTHDELADAEDNAWQIWEVCDS